MLYALSRCHRLVQSANTTSTALIAQHVVESMQDRAQGLASMHLLAFPMRLLSMSTPIMLFEPKWEASASVIMPSLQPMSRHFLFWNHGFSMICKHAHIADCYVLEYVGYNHVGLWNKLISLHVKAASL